MSEDVRRSGREYQLNEELVMWREAKRYYVARGWDDLTDTAEKQIKQIIGILSRRNHMPSHDCDIVRFTASERDEM